jgi:uncharacterized protein (DUF58 family)
VSPTPLLAWLLGALALLTLAVPPVVTGAAALLLVLAAAVDAWRVRRGAGVDREMPRIVVRGAPTPLTAAVRRSATPARVVRVRQAAVPDIEIEPREADWRLDAVLTARRRGRHPLRAPATRSVGPLGLGSAYRSAGEDGELLVYPDVPAARRLALAVRQGRFREQGTTGRGPIGLGTEFESVREYLPDDDVRQINWRATARTGRPMSNQYRVEQDRTVLCLVDTGRLMTAPLGDRTRLDAAVDAVVALALVADELGDRCGVLAFDDRVHRVLPARRGGGHDVVKAVFDLEPRPVDSDFEGAFVRAAMGKRALVFVFTDLLDVAAARSLLAAAPLLARGHAPAVATVRDPDLAAAVSREPRGPRDVMEASAAVEILAERDRVAVQLRRAGAQTVEASPSKLGAACVQAYLRAKARVRL